MRPCTARCCASRWGNTRSGYQAAECPLWVASRFARRSRWPQPNSRRCRVVENHTGAAAPLGGKASKVSDAYARRSGRIHADGPGPDRHRAQTRIRSQAICVFCVHPPSSAVDPCLLCRGSAHAADMAAECSSIWCDRRPQPDRITPVRYDMTERSGGSDVCRHLDGKSARAAVNSRVSSAESQTRDRTSASAGQPTYQKPLCRRTRPARLATRREPGRERRCSARPETSIRRTRKRSGWSGSLVRSGLGQTR